MVLNTNNPMLSSKLNILSHTSIPRGQIWKIPSQTRVMFSRQLFWSINNPILSLNLNISSNISVYLNIICSMLMMGHIFYFSSAILVAMNDNLELTVWCRLTDFFKDQIDMCSYSLLLVNSIFCCELHFLKTFSCVCQICSWGTNYTFLQLLPSKVFITIWLLQWGQF